MNRTRSVRPIHAIGLIVAAFLIGLIAWMMGGGTDQNEQAEPPTKSTAPAGENPPEPGPYEAAMPPERLRALEPAVQRFVETYYYRDAVLTESDLRRQLRPMVTATFLRQNPPEFSTESDEWVKREDGVITASATIRPSDAGLLPKRALVYLDVTVTGKTDSQFEPPYTFSVQVDLIWQDGWKVTAFV